MKITIEDGSGRVFEMTEDDGFFLRDVVLKVPIDGWRRTVEAQQAQTSLQDLPALEEVSDSRSQPHHCDGWQALDLLEKDLLEEMDRQIEEDPELRLLRCDGCPCCMEVFFSLHGLEGEPCPQCGGELMELLGEEEEDEGDA